MNIQLFTDNQAELKVRTFIPNTSPEIVYQCWTVAEYLEKWWVQKVQQLDVQPYGDYEFHWMVNHSTLRGKFLEVNPSQNLSFTWQWDHLPDLAERTVKLDFLAKDGGTQLDIWHGSYGESAPEQGERQNHIDGWQYFMELLFNFCAEGFD